jgi:hypothetical protein
MKWAAQSPPDRKIEKFSEDVSNLSEFAVGVEFYARLA